MNFSRMAHECTGALHARQQCMLVFLSSWLPHAAHSARSDSPSAMPLSANPSGKSRRQPRSEEKCSKPHLGRAVPERQAAFKRCYTPVKVCARLIC